jgi:hypothetical protein
MEWDLPLLRNEARGDTLALLAPWRRKEADEEGEGDIGEVPTGFCCLLLAAAAAADSFDEEGAPLELMVQAVTLIEVSGGTALID